MSKFLAPIHSLLFNKIIILERIEKELVRELDSQQLLAKHNELIEVYGDFIPNQPLEELIDQSNIHGWLQDRITIAERRQAAFVKILMAYSGDAVEAIINVYRKVGESVAMDAALKLNDPIEIFKALNDVLLEGMPCDRVNLVVNQSAENLIWKTQTCVHKANWEASGTDVVYYYKFREAFTEGFVHTVNNEFKYSYSFEGEQLHEIKKI